MTTTSKITLTTLGVLVTGYLAVRTFFVILLNALNGSIGITLLGKTSLILLVVLFITMLVLYVLYLRNKKASVIQNIIFVFISIVILYFLTSFGILK